MHVYFKLLLLHEHLDVLNEVSHISSMIKKTIATNTIVTWLNLSEAFQQSGYTCKLSI